MEDIEDDTNLTGLASLVNKHHVESTLDLDAIERSMIGGTGIKIIPESDPAKEFRNTIRELSNDTGITLDSGLTDEPETQEHDNQDQHTQIEPQEPVESVTHDQWTNNDTVDNDTGVNSDGNMEEIYERYAQRRQQSMPSRPTTSRPTGSRPIPNYRPQPGWPQQQSSGYSNYQQRPGQGQDHLDEALRAYGGPAPGAEVDDERENEEDTRGILLEDIDELRSELEDSGVDIKRIPDVNGDSELDEIKKIHKILRRKYDRKRCNSFGTEMILATAQGLEYAFDGKRKWGPYSPDLTGWHNTIRPKLRRMRYETSSIVSGIMQDYNIGPTARILLELVPSAFLYSRMRKEQHGKSNYSPDQMSEAFDDLRQYD